MRLLGFESWTIPLGASILDVTNTFKTALTGYGFQLMPGGDGTAMQWNITQGDFTNGTYPASNAFAYDATGSVAYITGAHPHYIGLTFDAAKTVSKFRLYVDNLANCPLTWDLQWSDDAGTTPTNWTTQQSYSFNQWRLYYPQFFTVDTPGSHRHWRLKINTSAHATQCQIAELTFYDANGNPSNKSDQCFLDLIPPSSEVLGNVNGFAYIRMRFNANTIRYATKMKLLTDLPQSFMISVASGSGNNSNSVTINGSQCAQDPGTLNAANTVFDNLYYLYLALRASNNANISAYRYEYVTSAALNGDESSVIRAIRKTFSATPDTISAGNCTYTALGLPVASGATTDNNGLYEGYYSGHTRNDGCGLEMTTDLVNGFVYYLSVYNRGFSLATKTNVGYYGPITVEWADNTKANAVLPQPLTKYITPVELFVIANGNASGIGGSYWDTNRIWSSHLLAMANDHRAQNLDATAYSIAIHPHQKCGFRGIVYDAARPANWGVHDNQLVSSGIWAGGSTGGSTGYVGDDFQVHRLTWGGSYVSQLDDSSYGYSSLIIPAVPLECHFMLAGTVNNEQLLLVSDTTVAATLVSDMDGTTAMDTITLSDTTSLAPSGYVIIDANGITEIVQYTAKNGNQLTGCTRNKYSSLRRPHQAGDEVRQGLWFVKINNAAMFCGYNRPS